MKTIEQKPETKTNLGAIKPQSYDLFTPVCRSINQARVSAYAEHQETNRLDLDRSEEGVEVDVTA